MVIGQSIKVPYWHTLFATRGRGLLFSEEKYSDTLDLTRKYNLVSGVEYWVRLIFCCEQLFSYSELFSHKPENEFTVVRTGYVPREHEVP